MRKFNNCIPIMVIQEQNQILQSRTTMEELKQVVFSMDPNSAVGPGAKPLQARPTIKHMKEAL